jgi:hypothetical protein
MGVEGLENIPDETSAEDRAAQEPRPDGEAERQRQDEEKLQDHEVRRERLREEQTPAPAEEEAPTAE